MAEKTTDISGKEQLSIGLHFFNKKTNKIEEKFLGFIELEELNAMIMIKAIENFVINLNLISVWG